mgnify:CR=1 FL=1
MTPSGHGVCRPGGIVSGGVCAPPHQEGTDAMTRASIALTAVALIAVVLAPGAAFAQFDGHWAELVFQGGASQPIAEDGTSTSYTVGTGIAIRTTERLRLGAEFAYNGIALNDDSQALFQSLGVEISSSMLEYGAFARYHLDEGLQGFYLKGSLGARQMKASVTGLGGAASGSETVLGYGLAVGWMLPGYSDVATFFEAEYGHAFPPEFEDAGAAPANQVGFDVFKLSIGAMFGTGF